MGSWVEGVTAARFVTTVRLNSSGIANVTKEGGDSKDVRILTCTGRSSSSFVQGKVVCGLSGATRDLASVVGGLRNSLGGSVTGMCMNVNKRSLHAMQGIMDHSLGRRAVVSRRLISTVYSRGLRVPLMSVSVLSITPRRCGVNGGLRTSPMKITNDRVRKHFLGVMTQTSVGGGLRHYFRRTGVRVTSLLVSPLMATGTMLDRDRHHSNYTLVSFKTSAAAVSICGGGVLHFLAILPLNKGDVAHSVASVRVRRRRTRHLGVAFKGMVCRRRRDRRTTAYRLRSKDHAIRLRTLGGVVRTQTRRVVAGM